MSFARVVDIDAVGIEGRQGAHGAGHDRHRVSVAAEAFEEPIELRVQHRVVGDVVLELGELVGRGQFAVQQQMADLKEGRLLGQLVDRIAAVQQNTGVAVDIGDLALARRRRGEARIEGEVVAFSVDFPDVENVRTRAALEDRQVVALVADRQRGFIGHT